MKFKVILNGAIVLSLLFSNVSTVGVGAENISLYNCNEEVFDTFKETDILANTEFSNNDILVYFKHQNSQINKHWESSDFNVDDIIKIEDLTHIDTNKVSVNQYLNNVTFRQIIKITVANSNRKKILDAIEKISSMNEVYMVTPDYFNQFDNSNLLDSTRQSFSRNIGGNYAFDLIDLEDAWNLCTGSSNVRVGVIDSGIDVDNPYLENNLTDGYNFISNNTNTDDDLGHGTNVAGIIGGSTTGVCPNVTLVPIKALNSQNQATNSSLINSITYANNNNIKIVNFSIGGPDFSGTFNGLENAIYNYNGLFVASAGNQPLDLDAEGTHNYIFCPTEYDAPNMITVAMSNSTDNIAYPSAYGNVSVDLAAPGFNVTTTDNNGLIVNNANGTSFAAPYVTGVAALLLSYNPNLTTAQLKYAIMDSVDIVSNLQGQLVTGGRLNAYNALNYVSSGSKVRNYVIRNEVSSSFATSQFTYMTLTFMKDLYQIDSVVKGDACPSNIDFNCNSQNSLWLQQTMLYFTSGVTATMQGSISNIKINSRFLGDRNNIESHINYASSHTGIVPNYILVGDVNQDGNINNYDKNLLSRVLLNDAVLSGDAKYSADTNQDNIINLDDLSQLNAYINNVINSFF